MKFRIDVEGGRMFFVKAEDVESAELVAKTCLKKGESIQGIKEVIKGEKGGEEKEKEKGTGEKREEIGPEDSETKKGVEEEL